MANDLLMSAAASSDEADGGTRGGAYMQPDNCIHSLRWPLGGGEQRSVAPCAAAASGGGGHACRDYDIYAVSSAGEAGSRNSSQQHWMVSSQQRD